MTHELLQFKHSKYNNISELAEYLVKFIQDKDLDNNFKHSITIELIEAYIEDEKEIFKHTLSENFVNLIFKD
jgi:hypothetical protein